MSHSAPSFGWFFIAGTGAVGYSALMVWWGVNAFGIGHGTHTILLAAVIGLPVWTTSAILLVWDHRGTAAVAAVLLAAHALIALTLIFDDWTYAADAFHACSVKLLGVWVLGQLILWGRIVAILWPSRK